MKVNLNRIYDCEKECSRPWMHTPLSAGFSHTANEYTKNIWEWQ